ncbi:Cerevisin [Arthrobotrys entomopaga]|nr:Cerevisin [Arthrobotrys entomopaga]
MKSTCILTVPLLLATIAPAFAAPSLMLNLNSLNQTTQAQPVAKEEYIIILSDKEKRPWNEVLTALGHQDTEDNIKTFGQTIRGATMLLNQTEQVRISKLPYISSIDKNTKARIVTSPHHENITRANTPQLRRRGTVRENNSTWGLQRISSTGKVDLKDRDDMDMVYKYRYDDQFDIGTGVDAYVVDTGIDVRHVDFGGRAKVIFSAFDGDMTDGQGHGTHLSGIIGSKTYGVAKNVNILGCKVFDKRGDGDINTIMKGVDAALASHNKRKSDAGFIASVMNLSLGDLDDSAVLFELLQKASTAGMHIVISAGNNGVDACKKFPAGYNQKIKSLIVVGASDPYDNAADFTNLGSCVDIHAPGVDVMSTYAKGLGMPGDIFPIDGTSQAAPHVAGVIAGQILKHKDLRLDPEGMKKLILGMGLKGVIKGAEKGGNILLNNGMTGNP